MIQTVKHNELARKEYHILPIALMDAFDEGEARGKSIGLAEGEIRGSRRKALETARLMKQADCDISFIEKMTGLSKEDIEAIN